MRSPAMLALAQDAYRQRRVRFVALAQLWVDTGQLPPDSDPAAVGAVLFALVPGFTLQRLILGDVHPESLAAGLASLTGWQPGPHSDAPTADGSPAAGVRVHAAAVEEPNG